MAAPIHTLNLHITNHCNSRCSHCTFWRTYEGMQEVKDFAPWYTLIQDVARISPGAVIQFTGGEPLLCDELFGLIQQAVDLPYRKTVVTTNGITWDENTAIRLCTSGLHELVISLDGFAETNDRLRGVPGSSDKVNRLIEFIHSQDRHPATLILTVISGRNIDEIKDFFLWAESIPTISSVYFQAITQPMPDEFSPQWHLHSELWPRDYKKAEDVLNWLIAARKQGRKVHNSTSQLETMKRYFADPLKMVWKECNIGTSYIIVNTDGGVKSCPMLPDLGNIHEADIRSILESPAAARRLEQMRSCTENCHFLVNCAFTEGELI